MASERKQVTALVGSVPLSTPSSETQINGNFLRAGRRVLAELACNDSPIVGLLPAGTPHSSCKDRSGHGGGPPRSRRALLADTLPSQTACTPLGETLLRSQVQLLLQKVGSDINANQHDKASSMYLGHAMEASPIMLAAPTPLNTPASVAIAQLPPCNSERAFSQDAMKDAPIENAEFQLSSALPTEKPGSTEEVCNGAPLSSPCLLNPAATRSSCKKLPELSSVQVSHSPSSAEIFVGKRVLSFDEDTPCKVSLKEGLDKMLSDCEADGCPPMRQLEDDEVSEWSVNVNVGSPVDKDYLIELTAGNTAAGSPHIVENTPILDERVRILQHVSSSKVQLLWDKDDDRITFKKDSHNEGQKESNNGGPDSKQNEEHCEYVDECASSDHGDDVWGDEECDDLCDMFVNMSFAEVGRGLPKGEGKHIRFLYEDGDDEIAEAMVVNEEDVLHSSTAIRLKGLPMPLGRHCRFVSDDE